MAVTNRRRSPKHPRTKDIKTPDERRAEMDFLRRKHGKPLICDREALGVALSRAMEPEAWAEYDAGGGRCSNQAGFKCLESLEHAGAALDHLATLGSIFVPPR